MFRNAKYVPLIVAFAVFVYPLNCSVLASERAEQQRMEILPGDVTGLLSTSAGEPLIDRELNLLDLEGKELQTVLTTEQGRFELTGLDEGQYMLALGGGYSLPIEVTKSAEISSMKIILPGAGPYESGAFLAALPIWAIIAGIAVITGTVIGVAASGDDETPSP